MNVILLIYTYEKNYFVVTKADYLIYDVIFSENTYYLIDISYYIDDIYQYEKFICDMKKIFKKAKITIVSSEININSKTVLWELKVNKQ